MTTLNSENLKSVTPSEADALLARESSLRLAAHKLGKRSSVRIQVLEGEKESEAITVPRLPLCDCFCNCSRRCRKAIRLR